MEIVKRIGIKQLRDATKFPDDPMKEGTVSGRSLVIGRIDDTKDGESQFGEYLRFNGAFQVRLDAGKGKVIQGTELFLPDAATGALEEAMGISDGGRVEFAFWIWRTAEKTQDETIKGFWHTEHAIEAADPFAALADRAMKGTIPASAAPAKK